MTPPWGEPRVLRDPASKKRNTKPVKPHTKPTKLMLDAFSTAEASNPDRVLITHGENGWSVSGSNTLLMRPNGSTTFDTPLQAFRVLAGAGIRSAVIEWDGVDAITE